MQTLFFQDFGEIIDVETIDQTCARTERRWRNHAVTIVTPGYGVMEYANANDSLAVHFQLNNLVSILRFATVSIMHSLLLGPQAG